jgi:hypothetical protein
MRGRRMWRRKRRLKRKRKRRKKRKMGRLYPGVSTVIAKRRPKLFEPSEMFGRGSLSVNRVTPCRGASSVPVFSALWVTH